MDFKLTDEQQMIQAAARDFARDEIAPIAHEFDASGEFPLETIQRMGELGLMGIEVPEEFGGSGLDTIGYALAMMEVSAADAAHGTNPASANMAGMDVVTVECAENGDVACDHYNRWPEDLDLVRDAGFDAYRFSTSWARVLPEGRGAPNQAGLDFYDRLVDGMLARGLKPAATLYHWELPQPLADMGGWRNADMPNWFGEFADVVARRLGDRLWSVAPINEPFCVAWLSHFEGAHAPGLRDIRATARAIHHVLKSHGTAVGVLRGHGLGNLGAALVVTAAAFRTFVTDDTESTTQS